MPPESCNHLEPKTDHEQTVPAAEESSYRRLLFNYVSLVANQGLIYILPLLTVPYLLRVLGAEKFGAVAFAQAFVQYFVILTEFGFNLSGPRLISISRHDTAATSGIYSRIMLIKFLLLVGSFTLFALITMAIPRFHEDAPVFYASFLLVAGNVLFPGWFFQGVEEMRYLTLLNFVAKGAYTITVFTIIKNSGDFIWVPLLNGCSVIFAGFAAQALVCSRFSVRFTCPSYRELREQFLESLPFFISNLGTSLYYNTNIFILGVFADKRLVGIYSAGEMLIRAVNDAVISPVLQSIYPYISRLYMHSVMSGLLFARKVLAVTAMGTGLVSVVVFIAAPLVVNMLFGQQYTESIAVVKILSVLPFFIGISGVLAMHVLLPLGMNVTFTRLVIVNGSCNLLLALLLCPLFYQIGMSWALVGAEIFAVIAVWIVLHSKGINILNPVKGWSIE